MRIVTQALMNFHQPPHEGFSHGDVYLWLTWHEVLEDVGLVLKVTGVSVYLLQVRLHFGQRLQPLGGEGGLSRFLFGFFGRQGFGEVGDVVAEGAGGVSGLNDAGARRAVHSLNLTLTAIRSRLSQTSSGKNMHPVAGGKEELLLVITLLYLSLMFPLCCPHWTTPYFPSQPFPIDVNNHSYILTLLQYSKMSTQAGGLIGILRNLRKNKKQQLRILVLGLDNSGKTTILKSLSNQDISTITPTQGFNIKNLTHDRFKLNVWDIGGQKALREYWGNYFTNTDALIYVIDSADTKRVKEAGEELEKLLAEKDLANVPVLVFANKQDLVQALQPDEILNNLKIENFGGRKWTIVACSAKTQEGLEDGLTWLVENVKK